MPIRTRVQFFVSGHDTAAYGGTTATGAAFDATVAASGPAFPAAVHASNRYWVDQNANPWFGVGDTAWSLVANLSTADITVYLEDRASRGVNLVLVNLVEHLFSDNAPNNINNDSPFTGTAFASTLRNAYWLIVDHAMSEAKRLGITILACPAYIGYEGTEEGWDTEIAAATNGNFTTYGGALASRYPSATYPNIIWLFGHDDVPTATQMARYDALGAALPSAHLIIPGGVYQTGGAGAAGSGEGRQDWTGSSTSFDGNTIYTRAGNGGQSDPAVYMLDIWADDSGPGGFMEGHYENESGTAQIRRDEQYATFCSGGCYALFGNSPIWRFNTGWEGDLDSTGSVQLGHLATLIAALGNRWAATVPDTTDTFQTTGSGYARFSTSTGLIYTLTGATLDLSEMSSTGSTALVRWFDPTNGNFTTVGTYATTAGRVISDPGANSAGAQDWVLVVTAVP